jgi:ABC-2 type transport system ATP-binding protein
LHDTQTVPASGAADAGRPGEGPPLLEVRDLSKEFGPVRAVDRLTFEVREGEIVGLLGPNGAGKTTAMRMLVGYLVPTSGSVRIAGGDVFREGSRIKGLLGYLPENIPLYGEMTVQEYLQMAASLKGLMGAQARREIDRTVGMLGLADMWRRPASQLSRGYRQRVGLAQCLLTDPRLLILDEPATGLDPNQIAEFRGQLRTWRSRKAILLSTHILAEALMLCDRVLILSRGRLAAAGTPQGLMGPDEGPLSTQVTVRGTAGEPLAGLADGLGLEAGREAAAGGGDEAVWHLSGRLDRAQRVALVRHLAAGGWEVVEWNTGLSALEQVFRRLTLEEGSDNPS